MLAPETVGAQPLDQGAVHTHDRLLLRLSLGAGQISMRQTRTIPVATSSGSQKRTERATLSGVGLLVSLDAGYALSDTFTLQLRLSQVLLDDPDVTGTGEAVNEPRDRAHSVLLAGPGLSVFLMPIHISATLAAGLALGGHPRYDGDDSAGDLGAACSLDLGKELWIGEQWSVGLLARGMLFTTSGEAHPRGEQSMKGYSVGLVASLSYQ